MTIEQIDATITRAWDDKGVDWPTMETVIREIFDTNLSDDAKLTFIAEAIAAFTKRGNPREAL